MLFVFLILLVIERYPCLYTLVILLSDPFPHPFYGDRKWESLAPCSFSSTVQYLFRSTRLAVIAFLCTPALLQSPVCAFQPDTQINISCAYSTTNGNFKIFFCVFICSMIDAGGLGLFPTATPFPRFRYWNLVFNFRRPGPLPVSASRSARCVRFVLMSIMTLLSGDYPMNSFTHTILTASITVALFAGALFTIYTITLGA